MLDFASMNGQIFKKDVRLFLPHSCQLPVKKKRGVIFAEQTRDQ